MNMKHSLPFKIESIKGQEAVVSFKGDIEVVILKCQAQVGDYVFIEKGCAVRRIETSEAEEILGMLGGGTYL